MAHSHSHAHGEPESTYFLDQLCTIVVGGLLGFTAIMLYEKGWLQSKFLLNERFHIPVLAAGIVLIVLVALRAIVLWKQAGEARSAQAAEAVQCDHDHGAGDTCDHGHAHGHDHGHSHSHSHSHSHGDAGHDHGWAPWQYAVLIIPAVLFFLGLPADGYNMNRLNSDLRDVELESGRRAQRLALAEVAGSMVLPTFKKSDPPLHLRFSELSGDAVRQSSRDALDGRTVILEGYYKRVGGSDNEFQLFRVMSNCCVTDSVTLRSLIIAPEPLQGLNFMDWVEIKGELTFQKVAGTGKWMPVIEIQSMKDIIKKQAPADPMKDV